MNAQHKIIKIIKRKERISAKAIMIFIRGNDMRCYLPNGYVHELIADKNYKHKLDLNYSDVRTVRDIIAVNKNAGYYRVR